jgi:hypothetical protein
MQNEARHDNSGDKPSHPPEAPLRTSPDGVEVEPRKTGHRFADFAIALSAIVISLVSLGIAIHHGKVQERLVAANSWPFLMFGTSNQRREDGQRLTMAIENSGVGPAVLKSLVVNYRGKPVRGWVELLQECCDVSRDIRVDQLVPLGVKGDSRPVGVIRAREQAVLLALARTPENGELWNKFAAARLQLTFEGCYCSIVGECWKSDLITLDPQRVEQCVKGPNDYVEFGAGLDDSESMPLL